MTMAMDDIIETPPAKKMKLQDDEEIPKSQDGTNTVNFEDPQPTMKYYVHVEFKVVTQLRSSRENPLCLFGRMMKDVGCSESQIFKDSFYSSYCFFAQLTPDKAKKLSDLDTIREVKPYKEVPSYCRNQMCRYRERVFPFWWYVGYSLFGGMFPLLVMLKLYLETW